MIRCIFYSEFDNIVGPKITYQVPAGYISNEVFDAISEYFITKPQLAGRDVITLTTFGYTIMGFPMGIEGRKYHRNALLWNLAFVFESIATVGCQLTLPENVPAEIYQPVLRKLGFIFRALETESEFLFRPESKKQIERILEQMFEALNTVGECSIPVDDTHVISLRLIPNLQAPPPVRDHDVPVAVTDLDALVRRSPNLDLTIVVQFIDGISYTKKISQESGVSLELVRKALQHLLYFGFIKIVDVFQYSNFYAVTPKIARLAEDEDMQRECLKCITVPGTTPATIEEIFSLYASLTSSTSFREFCQEHDDFASNIDDRCFIIFGLVNGLVRRVHQYAIAFLSPDELARLLGGDVAKEKSLQRMMDGKHSFDEICCAFGISHSVLDDLVQADKHAVTIYK